MMVGNLSTRKNKCHNIYLGINLIIIDTLTSFLAHFDFNICFSIISIIVLFLWLFIIVNSFPTRFNLPGKSDWLKILLLVAINEIIFYVTVNHISNIQLSRINDFKLNVASMFMAIIIGPVIEEIIFRGIIANCFKNETINMIVSCLLFAFLHGSMNFIAIILYLIFALSSFYLYKKNGHLIDSILFHIFFNLISIFFTYS